MSRARVRSSPSECTFTGNASSDASMSTRKKCRQHERRFLTAKPPSMYQYSHNAATIIVHHAQGTKLAAGYAVGSKRWISVFFFRPPKASTLSQMKWDRNIETATRFPYIAPCGPASLHNSTACGPLVASRALNRWNLAFFTLYKFDVSKFPQLSTFHQVSMLRS